IEDGKITDKLKLVTSSTPAMLSELKKATEAEKPIVVTLWHPHWAYAAYPIKDLKDPDGAMGDKEEIHIVGRQDVADDFPTFRDALSDWTMDDDTLASLEKTVIQEHEDDPEAGVDEWVKDNEDFVKKMSDSLKQGAPYNKEIDTRRARPYGWALRHLGSSSSAPFVINADPSPVYADPSHTWIPRAPPTPGGAFETHSASTSV